MLFILLLSVGLSVRPPLTLAADVVFFGMVWKFGFVVVVFYFGTSFQKNGKWFACFV